MEQSIMWLLYLVSSVTFILGLKMLSHPDTARRGNLIAAGGMGLAIFTTIFMHENAEGEKIGNYVWIFGGMAIGTIVGWMVAKRVKMTAMPQMVSLFNGMGGACAALISLVEISHYDGGSMMNEQVFIILLGLLIGSVSFSGSMVAYGKLEGIITEKSVALPFQSIINLIILGGIIGLGVYMMTLSQPEPLLIYGMFVAALIYGILFVLPIGGADMPVVISLLNSFTGIAAACGGFIYNNQVMITGGILVGSAGTILTLIMVKAMNRSLLNVIVGSFGGVTEGSGEGGDQGTVKETTSLDVAIMLSYAKKVLIVPGYGLAVAQAQHTCHELDKALEEKGVEVKYAIHPVAGRMPGHMNVLLAEADVPYPKLMEMEDANPEFKNTQVTLVVGANDVVNPAAKTDKSSPIYGMPVLDVEDSDNVIIIKRSMRSGYAGIQNELFFYDNTKMLFGDAKEVIQQLVSDVRAN